VHLVIYIIHVDNVSCAEKRRIRAGYYGTRLESTERTETSAVETIVALNLERETTKSMRAVLPPLPSAGWEAPQVLLPSLSLALVISEVAFLE
jgi:hypothetical protein